MDKIKLIIHLADVHIRLYQRLDEYAEVLETFIEKCKNVVSEYKREEIRIVISGDLFNNKNNVSNELMVFASYFLRQLEETINRRKNNG